jgi:hypothetical protein
MDGKSVPIRINRPENGGPMLRGIPDQNALFTGEALQFATSSVQVARVCMSYSRPRGGQFLNNRRWNSSGHNRACDAFPPVSAMFLGTQTSR